MRGRLAKRRPTTNMLLNKQCALKVPKCEILDRSDFHYFHTIKPFWVDDFVVKILTYYFNFWGAKPHLFSDA